MPSSFIEKGEIQRYVEPFAGGGALSFKRQLRIKSFFTDVNKELMAGYWVVQRNVNELIDELSIIEGTYMKRRNSRGETLL